MIEKILKFADEFDMLPESGLVLACVSGGADSMTLFDALLKISKKRGFTVAAVHYNHKLRGGEADRDEAFVKDYCKTRNTAFFCGSGDVRAHAREFGLSIEEAARDKRYVFFCMTAEKAGAVGIATAHTAEDNAETIIMNLVRGAGAAGLSGIPPVREMLHKKIIRPMLRVSREEVMRYIAENGIPFAEDSTNSRNIYTRNKVRNIVMPVLRELNPRISEAEAAASELIRTDDEYLSKIADAYIADNCPDQTADAARLLSLPFAISGRVIRKLCSEKRLSYNHVKAVLELCEKGGPSSRLSLPGMTVYREYENVVFAEAGGGFCFDPVPITEGETLISGLRMSVLCKTVICDGTFNKSFTSFLFKRVDICGKISVRPRREGDFIKLNGQNGAKALKKLFIERRIPAGKRALVPIVADETGVLAVFGIGMGSRAVPALGDVAVQIEFIAEN